MLCFLDVLGVLVQRKVIGMDDVLPLAYEILRVYQNPEVGEYLQFLRGWYEHHQIPREPFHGFLKLAEKISREISRRKGALMRVWRGKETKR